MNIKSIRIKNFKSIEDITIENIENFSVFTGPNGSGKSNIFEALEFVRDIVLNGAREKYNGFNNICHFELTNSNKQNFYMLLSLEINDNSYDYKLEIDFLNLGEPIVYEDIIKNKVNICNKNFKNEYLKNRTILKFLGDETKDLFDFFKSIAYYKMNLLDISGKDNFLNNSIFNISSNLYNLVEKSFINKILNSVNKIFLDLGELGVIWENNIAVFFFRDKDSKKIFYNESIPYSISQVLNILTIIYFSKKSLIMIEGIERGLSPETIYRLIQLIRENNKDFNIFISTYSESILKLTQINELFFIDKKKGKTEIHKRKTLKNNLTNINYIHNCDICQKMIDLSYDTWDRIKFVRNSILPLKIRETTITENLLYELVKYSQNCLFKEVVAFEAFNEITNGNDIEFFIQQANGKYIFFPVQAKVLSNKNIYEQIPYVSKSGVKQNDILINYAILNKGIPLYLLYNYFPNNNIYKNYGCSIVDASYIKKYFSTKTHPTFDDLHITNNVASPWYTLVCKSYNKLKDKSITLNNIYRESDSIKMYEYNDLFDNEKWKLIDFQNSDLKESFNTKEKDFFETSSEEFAAKYRFVFSNNMIKKENRD